jgi:hypothetical protein
MYSKSAFTNSNLIGKRREEKRREEKRREDVKLWIRRIKKAIFRKYTRLCFVEC